MVQKPFNSTTSGPKRKTSQGIEESSLMGSINKIGNALLLNILFILCCLPVITAGASMTAYYYSMVKCVRRERSYPAKEFFAAFKRAFKRSTLIWIMIIAAGVLLFVNREYCARELTGTHSVMMVAAYDVMILLIGGFLVYVFPVISRFDRNFKDTLRLSLSVTAYKPYMSLAVMALWALTVWLCVRFSIGFTLVFPAAACYLSTFLTERQFAHFIEKPGEKEDGWYYGE